LQEKITHIKQKLQQLIKQYQQLQKDNLQLKNQVDKAATVIKENNKTIESLQQKLDVKLIEHFQLNKQDKQALERRVDSYLKEIDLCISLLNKD
jgi:chromosome segregation ATPase